MLNCTMHYMKWRDTSIHRPFIYMRTRSKHCVQTTAPNHNLSKPRLEPIPHLHIFSDNCVYVALQQLLVVTSSSYREHHV